MTIVCGQIGPSLSQQSPSRMENSRVAPTRNKLLGIMHSSFQYFETVVQSTGHFQKVESEFQKTKDIKSQCQL